MSDLLRTAIVGTGQLPSEGAASAESADGDGVATLVARLSSCDRERALLLRAGGEALLRRGARQPQREVARSAVVSAPDPRPFTGPRVTEIVRALLRDGPADLLSHVLDEVARRGFSLAPSLLPLALRKTGAVCSQLGPVLGPRGAWLAAQRPEWAWARARSLDGEDALPSDLDARFETASHAEQLALIALARRVEPARARTLAAATWPELKPAQKVELLEVFERGLGPDDVPMLEAFGDTRSGEVRTAVARLAWRLPESAIAQRVRARAQAGACCLPRRAASGERTGSWELTPPEDPFTAEWKNDGLIATPSRYGKRAAGLQQLIAAVDPELWMTGADLPIEAVLAAAVVHDDATLLLEGLTEAALFHERSAWLAPLWDVWSASKLKSVRRVPWTVELALVMERARLDERVAHMSGDDLSVLAMRLPGPWSAAVAEAYLAWIAARQVDNPHVLRAGALAIALAALPPEAPILHAQVPALADFQQIVALRRSIAEEINRG